MTAFDHLYDPMSGRLRPDACERTLGGSRPDGSRGLIPTTDARKVSESVREEFERRHLEACQHPSHAHGPLVDERLDGTSAEYYGDKPLSLTTMFVLVLSLALVFGFGVWLVIYGIKP